MFRVEFVKKNGEEAVEDVGVVVSPEKKFLDIATSNGKINIDDPQGGMSLDMDPGDKPQAKGEHARRFVVSEFARRGFRIRRISDL
jgi:hypothetical protein